jgi:hypothetical protein
MSVQAPEFAFPTPKTGIKNIWSIESVAPCPHNPMHAWVIQILEGHIPDGGGPLVKAGKHKTRLIYVKMDENGKIENIHAGSGE